MMKKHVTMIMTAALLTVGSNAFAADYSRMSTEELVQMRPSIETADAKEKKAFEKEWNKRLKAMTPEERRQVEEAAAASDAAAGTPANAQPGMEPVTPGAPQADPMGNQQLTPQENQPASPDMAPQDNEKSDTQKKSKKK